MNDLKNVIGETVNVYYNLHKHLWSIKYKGKVIGHVRHLNLRPSKFHVNENGRQRTIEKHKEVHAWVTGQLINFKDIDPEGLDVITYNPHMRPDYHQLIDGTNRKSYNLDAIGLLNFNANTRKLYVVS